jgi:hypothetical protein
MIKMLQSVETKTQLRCSGKGTNAKQVLVFSTCQMQTLAPAQQ